MIVYYMLFILAPPPIGMVKWKEIFLQSGNPGGFMHAVFPLFKTDISLEFSRRLANSFSALIQTLGNLQIF